MSSLNKKLLTTLVLSGLALSSGGCGQSGGSAHFTCGPVDNEYRGVVPAVLTPKFKITQEELANGIQKEPLRAPDGQILTPESRVEEYSNKTREGADNAPKPNI